MKAQNEYAMADKTYSKIFLIKERALLFGCTINMGMWSEKISADGEGIAKKKQQPKNRWPQKL